MSEAVDTLLEIIDRAQGGEKAETVLKSVQDMGRLGGVSSLAFYTLCVHVGLLCSSEALEQSFGAVLGEGSPLAVRMMKLGCPKAKLQDSLKRLAKMRGTPRNWVENLGCKVYRGMVTWDVVVEDQWLYDRMWVDGDGGERVVRLVRKRLGEHVWRLDVPPTLDP